MTHSRRHVVCEFCTGTFLLRPTARWRAASGFTTSRAHAMKSFATGLHVRFFRVMIPTGQGGIGKLTGRTVCEGKCVPRRNTDPGIGKRKGPLARSAKNK